MNYDLAVKLKEAGFPQGGRGAWLGNPRAVVLRSGDRVYTPTLSELIDRFAHYASFSLELKAGHKSGRWQAAASLGGQEQTRVHGSTPDEAAARLWLLLGSRLGETAG